MGIRSTQAVAAGVAPPRKSAKDDLLAGWASMAGTTIAWYDFFLYGTAAALVFNKILFHTRDPIRGTLAAFATYGVGLIGRPMGGIVSDTPDT
jgi:MHS family shikimate/dehydroshikimate transporter-like MFS transporter